MAARVSVSVTMNAAGGAARARHVSPLLRVVAAVALLLSAASTVAAQPALRIGGSSGVVVEGTDVDGSAAFPARALEALGFRIAAAPTGFTAVLGTDTLHFWPTSPFFRAGPAVHQLAFAALERNGDVWLPEQFFIQWLPGAFPDRFQYRNGALLTGGGSVTTVARTEQPAPVAAHATGNTAERGSAVPARAAAATSGGSRAERRLVVIDPGHGGRDPGKVGTNGVREKDVTLQVSQRLAKVLEERGYEVRLTRTTDTYVSLYDRPKLANEWKGDRPVAVFLSIHANSAPTSRARGFETFFLSDARTDDERRVAEMENESIRFDVSGPSAPDAGLDQILSTLRSDFLMRASHDLAAVVQEHMAQFHPGPNRGVKRAGFVVLVGAVMPAVLIETAFMSNREDARLLGTQSFQEKIAWGIADSVDEFFVRNEHLWETR